LGNCETLKNTVDNDKTVQTTENTLKYLSLNHMAWLLPATILVHRLEEYFGQFPRWYSNLFKYTVVQPGFHCYQWSWPVRIHRIFLSYIFDKNNTILVALGTLVFVNGMVHLVLSIFTFSYSPGTISSVVLFIPLGIIIFKRILP
jgi:hypothetical protein